MASKTSNRCGHPINQITKSTGFSSLDTLVHWSQLGILILLHSVSVAVVSELLFTCAPSSQHLLEVRVQLALLTAGHLALLLVALLLVALLVLTAVLTALLVAAAALAPALLSAKQVRRHIGESGSTGVTWVAWWDGVTGAAGIDTRRSVERGHPIRAVVEHVVGSTG